MPQNIGRNLDARVQHPNRKGRRVPESGAAASAHCNWKHARNPQDAPA